jgi:nitronate monooxygenase
MQAPVGSAATARLASEVSRAGGVGSLGASWTDPGILRERIRSIARVTDRPFCVNLVLDFEQEERLEVAVEERAPVVSFSFGLRPELIARAHAGGARVLVQVGSVNAARAAADAGADALIVQGARLAATCRGRAAAAAVGAGATRGVAAVACRGRHRRSDLGAGRARQWRSGGRHGHPIPGDGGV